MANRKKIVTPFERDNLTADLSAYLDGELDAERCAEMERALAQDEALRDALARLRAVSAGLASLPRVKAPVGMAREVRTRIESPGAPRVVHRWTVWISGASAAALLALVWLGLPLSGEFGQTSAPPMFGLPVDRLREEKGFVASRRPAEVPADELLALGYVGGDVDMAEAESEQTESPFARRRSNTADASETIAESARFAKADPNLSGRVRDKATSSKSAGQYADAEGLDKQDAAPAERAETESALRDAVVGQPVANAATPATRGGGRGGAAEPAIPGGELANSSSNEIDRGLKEDFDASLEVSPLGGVDGVETRVLVLTTTMDEYNAAVTALSPDAQTRQVADARGRRQAGRELLKDDDEADVAMMASMTLERELTPNALGRMLAQLSQAAPRAMIEIERPATLDGNGFTPPIATTGADDEAARTVTKKETPDVARSTPRPAPPPRAAIPAQPQADEANAQALTDAPAMRKDEFGAAFAGGERQRWNQPETPSESLERHLAWMRNVLGWYGGWIPDQQKTRRVRVVILSPPVNAKPPAADKQDD